MSVSVVTIGEMESFRFKNPSTIKEFQAEIYNHEAQGYKSSTVKSVLVIVAEN